MAIKGIKFNNHILEIPQEYIKSATVSGNSIVFVDNNGQQIGFTPQQITVDEFLSATSPNPIRNSTVTTRLNEISNAIPTKVSDLDNDSGYITEDDIPTALSDLTEDETHQTVTAEQKTAWNSKIVLSDIPSASTAEQGLIKIATDQEIQDGTNETSAVTPKQLKTAINGIGTVFDLKGSLNSVADLPTTNNKIGDVWYVKDESVGYIWLNDGDTNRWEQLGPSLDLSGFVQYIDIINNLTSTDTDKPLSAYQGNLLDQKITQEVSDRTSAVSGLQSQINNIAVPEKLSDLDNDMGFLTSAPVSSVNSKTGAVVLTAGDVGALPDTTIIPSTLAELTGDTTHRTVTDAEKTSWNNKLSSYTETDPTVPSHVKSITQANITAWNAKANDSDVVHLTGNETINGTKYIVGNIYFGKTNGNVYQELISNVSNGTVNLKTAGSTADGAFFVNGKGVVGVESYTRVAGSQAWSLRLTNGTQFCWGYDEAGLSTYSKTVTLPKPYVNQTAYVVMGTPTAQGSDTWCFYALKTSSSAFTWRNRSGASGVYWFTVGAWR